MTTSDWIRLILIIVLLVWAYNLGYYSATVMVSYITTVCGQFAAAQNGTHVEVNLDPIIKSEEAKE